MQKQIQDMIARYTNHLDSWKHSLRTYENGLKKAHPDDAGLVRYWNENIQMAKSKIETYQQVVADFESLLD